MKVPPTAGPSPTAGEISMLDTVPLERRCTTQTFVLPAQLTHVLVKSHQPLCINTHSLQLLATEERELGSAVCGSVHR
jgi:hypothetical protein